MLLEDDKDGRVMILVYAAIIEGVLCIGSWRGACVVVVSPYKVTHQHSCEKHRLAA